MSHFTGLVVLTPQYLKKHDLEESLKKYSENMEVPEYSKGPVSDYAKIDFISWYKTKDGTISPEHDAKGLWSIMYDRLLNSGKVREYDELKDRTLYLFLTNTLGEKEYKKLYVELFNELYPNLINEFDSLYQKEGSDWNGNSWRFNYITNQWEEYSRYNPDSKWDWYTDGGRWDGSIKMKDGDFVNSGILGDIDWADFKPEDYAETPQKDWLGEEYYPLKDDIKWHYTKSSVPFCLVVDGVWMEKGQMGWFGISTNNKKQQDWNDEFFSILDRLPENSEFHLIDFHI